MNPNDMLNSVGAHVEYMVLGGLVFLLKVAYTITVMMMFLMMMVSMMMMIMMR